MPRFKIILEFDPLEKTYTVTVPALPGCVTQAPTLAEARKRAKEAIECTLEGFEALEKSPEIKNIEVLVEDIEIAA